MTDILKTHPHYLFVYGTLKPGHGNNPLITKHGGKDIGPAQTAGKFLLNDGFPYVWQLPKGYSADYTRRLGHVVGHLYMVSDAGLEACDRLEGHPRHYCRTPISVTYGVTGATQRNATAGIYLIPWNQPHPNDLQEPRDGLLEWGRDEPKRAQDFQRRRAR